MVAVDASSVALVDIMIGILRRNFGKTAWMAISFALFVVATLAGLSFIPHHMQQPLKLRHGMIEEGTWAGFDPAALAKQIGSPTMTFQSYVQVGPDQPKPMPPGPYMTWRYDHAAGTLYVWFSTVDGKFRSFDSLWFDRGVEF